MSTTDYESLYPKLDKLHKNDTDNLGCKTLVGVWGLGWGLVVCLGSNGHSMLCTCTKNWYIIGTLPVSPWLKGHSSKQKQLIDFKVQKLIKNEAIDVLTAAVHTACNIKIQFEWSTLSLCFVWNNGIGNSTSLSIV